MRYTVDKTSLVIMIILCTAVSETNLASHFCPLFHNSLWFFFVKCFTLGLTLYKCSLFISYDHNQLISVIWILNFFYYNSHTYLLLNSKHPLFGSQCWTRHIFILWVSFVFWNCIPLSSQMSVNSLIWYLFSQKSLVSLKRLNSLQLFAPVQVSNLIFLVFFFI